LFRVGLKWSVRMEVLDMFPDVLAKTLDYSTVCLGRVYNGDVPKTSVSPCRHWGCAKPSHTQTIQRLQSKILRSVTNAPWYVSNCTLQNDLHIPLVATEINRLSLLYHKRLVDHHNALITAMATPPTIVRRLKRQWPTDLFHTAAGD